MTSVEVDFYIVGIDEPIILILYGCDFISFIMDMFTGLQWLLTRCHGDLLYHL